MPDSDRQRKIWDALEKEYGAESVERAGALLAITPDEWDLDESPDAWCLVVPGVPRARSADS